MVQRFGDCRDGIPVAGCRRNSKHLIEPAQIANDFHVASVQTKDEPAIARENSQ